MLVLWFFLFNSLIGTSSSNGLLLTSWILVYLLPTYQTSILSLLYLFQPLSGCISFKFSFFRTLSSFAVFCTQLKEYTKRFLNPELFLLCLLFSSRSHVSNICCCTNRYTYISPSKKALSDRAQVHIRSTLSKQSHSPLYQVEDGHTIVFISSDCFQILEGAHSYVEKFLSTA